MCVGIDFYNQCTTGSVSMSIRATKGDTDHIPCVLIGNEDKNDISKENRASDGKHASRKL